MTPVKGSFNSQTDCNPQVGNCWFKSYVHPSDKQAIVWRRDKQRAELDKPSQVDKVCLRDFEQVLCHLQVWALDWGRRTPSSPESYRTNEKTSAKTEAVGLGRRLLVTCVLHKHEDLSLIPGKCPEKNSTLVCVLTTQTHVHTNSRYDSSHGMWTYH